MSGERGVALVTGATGCLGSAVVRALGAAGWRTRALVRDPGAARGAADELHAGDLLRPATVRGACEGADAVVHAAALVSDWGDGEEIWRINRDGTDALIDDALACGVRRFVYVSTIDVFGFRRGASCDERSPRLCPRYPYSQSKLAGETLTWAARRRGLGASVVYPAWVYGPGDRHLVPELVDGLRTRQLLHFDRGEPPLELTYSENAAEAIALVAGEERAEGEGYIVGDGLGVTLGMFVEELARQAGLPPPRASIPFSLTYAAAAASELLARATRSQKRPLMTRYAIRSVACGMRFSSAKVRELGWAPRVGLSEGVARTLASLDVPAPGPAPARSPRLEAVS